MSLPFQVRQSTAKQIYGRQLHTLLESGRMHDQSISLERDLNSYAKMELDTTVAHLRQVRKLYVAGSRWQIEPASPRPIDKKAANALERTIDAGLGQRFAEARFNLAEAVFEGSKYGRMNGELRWISNLDDTGIPQRVWVPTEIVDVDRRRFDKVVHHLDYGKPTERYEVEWRMFDVTTNDWRKWEHPEWYIKHVYNPTETSLFYGEGLLDKMYFYWRAKEILLKSGLQAAERWAQGFMVASVDNARNASSGKTNAALVQSFINELTRQRSQHIFVKDKLDELEVLPGPGQGWEIVKYMLDYCDTQLRLLVLGSNLPTEAKGGGSYALADVQQDTTSVIVKYDRRLMGETLTRDLVAFTWSVNRPVYSAMGLGGAEMPHLIIVDENVANPKEEAEINKIMLDSGMDLDAEEAYEVCKRTRPAPGRDVIPGRRAPDPMEGGGMFGESGFEESFEEDPDGPGRVQKARLQGRARRR